MRILIRTSRLAIWSRRLAGFAFPVLVLSIALHRGAVMPTDLFETCLLIAFILAGLAVGLGLSAWIRLWYTGDRGWGRASAGIFVGLLTLAPFGYAVYLVLGYPSTADVSTDSIDPPTLIVDYAGTPATLLEPETIASRFPHLVTRNYQLDAAIVYELAGQIALRQNWEMERAFPPVAGGEGQFNAIDTTWLGWRDEVAVRVSGVQGGAEVAMRSASTAPVWHDLGHNGRRIEAFMLALDAEVTTVLREGPVDDSAPPPPPADEPQPLPPDLE